VIEDPVNAEKAITIPLTPCFLPKGILRIAKARAGAVLFWRSAYIFF